VSTPNPPADGSGRDDAGQQPAPEQSPWSQPPAAPPVAPPMAPPVAPPVAPPAYGQQPPADPYGQQPPPPPGQYGQPPPPGPYGQQPPAPYGQPPPPAPYGQPPPPAPYGQPPPPAPYGQQPPADPYGQQQPYAPTAGYPVNPYGAVALPKESYASWGQRVGAYLLDYLLTLPFAIVGLILIVVGAASTASSITYNSATGTYDSNGAGLSLLAVLGYLIWVIGAIGVTAWNRWYQGGKTGQSWGKRVMGIKLVREADGQPLGAGMAFVRDLAHVVDGLICYIGYLFPLWDVKRQTLADKILHTAVYPGAPKSSKLF
jgi:uncharacterized RDD family membrane protein YckC